MKKLTKLTALLLSSTILVACSNFSFSKDSTKQSSTSKMTTKKSDSKINSNNNDFVSQASEATFSNNVLKGNSYTIKITDYKVLQPHEEGNESDYPIIVFFYDTLVASNYDNSVPMTPTTAWALNFIVSQNNELDYTTYFDEELLDNSSEEISPGNSLKSAVAYTLTDTDTPVKVVAEAFEHKYGEQTFTIGQ